MEQVQENKMGTAPVLWLIIAMSLPAMFSMLVQALYNVVDSYFVSQVSENANTGKKGNNFGNRERIPHSLYTNAS